jgi:photosynthetic reaction center H subunit
MGTGYITQGIDVAQLVLYAFWIFFAGLVYYLARENHREGYPMETTTGRGVIGGWPVPESKTYLLTHGGEAVVPNPNESRQTLAAEPANRWAGAPLVPTGANPLLDGVGPGAWADRADHPDRDYHGAPKLAPLRLCPDFSVQRGDVDPRGLPVVGADGVEAGKVVDLWVDISETLFRWIEMEVEGGGRRVMVPMNFARITRDKVSVGALLGKQFAAAPGIRQPDVITMLEEEKIWSYFGAGTLYAEPERQEPLL